MKNVDALVVGAGLSGMASAASLSEFGYDVTVLEPRRTTPNKSLYVNSQNLPPELVEHAQANQGLFEIPRYDLQDLQDTTQSMQLDGPEGGFTTGVLDHDIALAWLRQRTVGNPQRIQASYRRARETSSGVRVELSSGEEIQANLVVDASGDRSSVQRKTLGIDGEPLLDDDPIVLWMQGAKFETVNAPQVLVNPLSEDVGLAWIVPSGSGELDIISSEHSLLSRQPNASTRQRMLDETIEWTLRNTDFKIGDRIHPLSGIIRVCPIPHDATTNTERVYAVGGSAGMTEPLNGELASPALHWGLKLGSRVKDGAAPKDFFTEWRHDDPMFPYNLYLGVLKRRMDANADGRVGKTTEIYKLMSRALSPEEQQGMVNDRKVPPRAIGRIMLEIAKQPSTIPNLLEIGKYYIREERHARRARQELRVA